MKAKKEVKYFVLKWDDINELSDYQRHHLKLIIMGIDRRRKEQGKKIWSKNKYIICNRDEPYSEKIWQAILDGEDSKK